MPSLKTVCNCSFPPKKIVQESQAGKVLNDFRRALQSSTSGEDEKEASQVCVCACVFVCTQSCKSVKMYLHVSAGVTVVHFPSWSVSCLVVCLPICWQPMYQLGLIILPVLFFVHLSLSCGLSCIFLDGFFHSFIHPRLSVWAVIARGISFALFCQLRKLIRRNLTKWRDIARESGVQPSTSQNSLASSTPASPSDSTETPVASSTTTSVVTETVEVENGEGDAMVVEESMVVEEKVESSAMEPDCSNSNEMESGGVQSMEVENSGNISSEATPPSSAPAANSSTPLRTTSFMSLDSASGMSIHVPVLLLTPRLGASDAYLPSPLAPRPRFESQLVFPWNCITKVKEKNPISCR
mgnify:CR=1 FL=1